MEREEKNKKYRQRKLKLESLEEQVEKLSLDLETFFEESRKKLEYARKERVRKLNK